MAHLDKPMYLLGYLPKEDRAYLADKDFNVVSYAISVVVLQYQTCVMRRDFTAADQLMSQIPADQRTRVARFLEKQGLWCLCVCVCPRAHVWAYVLRKWNSPFCGDSWFMGRVAWDESWYFLNIVRE